MTTGVDSMACNACDRQHRSHGRRLARSNVQRSSRICSARTCTYLIISYAPELLALLEMPAVRGSPAGITGARGHSVMYTPLLQRSTRYKGSKEHAAPVPLLAAACLPGLPACGRWSGETLPRLGTHVIRPHCPTPVPTQSSEQRGVGCQLGGPHSLQADNQADNQADGVDG
jgi:hypothetical protein